MEWNTGVSILQILMTWLSIYLCLWTYMTSLYSEILLFLTKMFILEELKFIILEFMFNTTLLDLFTLSELKKKKKTNWKKFTNVNYWQALRLLWSLHSQNLFWIKAPNTQSAFEEAWLKILACYTITITTIHISSAFLKSSAETKENNNNKKN